MRFFGKVLATVLPASKRWVLKAWTSRARSFGFRGGGVFGLLLDDMVVSHMW